MNILEAVRSGKPFKRAHDHIWIKELKQFFVETEVTYRDFLGRQIILAVLEDGRTSDLWIEDLFSDYWMVKENVEELAPCPFCESEMKYKNNGRRHEAFCVNTKCAVACLDSIREISKQDFIKKCNEKARKLKSTEKIPLEEKANPCPHCGSNVSVETEFEDLDNKYWLYSIEFENKNCIVNNNLQNNKRQLVTLWNARV